MSFVKSFGVLPDFTPRSTISNAVLPWNLPQRSHVQRQKQTAAPPPAEPAIAQPQTSKPVEAIEPPVTFFSMLVATLEQLHKQHLTQQLDRLPQLAAQRGVKLFCINRDDRAVNQIIAFLRGFDDQRQGSFALLGEKIPTPIIVLCQAEINAIAAKLGLKPWAVAQSMCAHELGHALGWEVYKMGVDEPGLLAEETAWQWGQNIRSQFGTVSETSFKKIANYCLQTHDL